MFLITWRKTKPSPPTDPDCVRGPMLNASLQYFIKLPHANSLQKRGQGPRRFKGGDDVTQLVRSSATVHLAPHHLLKDSSSFFRFFFNISESLLGQKGIVVKNIDSGTRLPGFQLGLVQPLTSCVTLRCYSTTLCINYLIWKKWK